MAASTSHTVSDPASSATRADPDNDDSDAQPTPTLPCRGSPVRNDTPQRISATPSKERIVSASNATFCERALVAATAADVATSVGERRHPSPGVASPADANTTLASEEKSSRP